MAEVTDLPIASYPSSHVTNFLIPQWMTRFLSDSVSSLDS